MTTDVGMQEKRFKLSAWLLTASAGVGAGAGFILAESVLGSTAAIGLVVGLPVVFLATVRADLLVTFLFATSGTALAGVVVGRGPLLAQAGGLNASSLGLAVALTALLATLVIRTGWISSGLRPAIPHAVFVGFAALSIAWTPSTLLGLREWAKLLFPLVVVAVTYAIWRRRPRPSMFQIMFWAGVLIAVTGPFVFLAGNPGVVPWLSGRGLYSGSWGLSSYTFGAYTGLLATYVLVRYRTVRRRWLLPMALLFVLSTLATGVRSAIFPLFFVGAAYLYLQSRNPLRSVYLAGGLIGLVIAVTAIPWLRARTFTGLAAEVATPVTLLSEPGRLLTLDAIRWTRGGAWGSAAEVYFSNPILGGGLGAVRAQFVGQFESTIAGAGRGGFGVGQYLAALGDLGLVGLGLFLLTFVTYGLRLKRDFEVRREWPRSGYSLLAFLWLLYFAGFSFAYSGFGTWTISFLVFAVTGIALAEAHRVENDDGIYVWRHGESRAGRLRGRRSSVPGSLREKEGDEDTPQDASW